MAPSQHLIVDAIAVARLTRLVTADDIAEPLREAWLKWAYGTPLPEHAVTWTEAYETDRNPPKLATLIMCRWCVSMWIGLGVMVFARRVPGWRPVANALMASHVAALAERLE